MPIHLSLFRGISISLGQQGWFGVFTDNLRFFAEILREDHPHHQSVDRSEKTLPLSLSLEGGVTVADVDVASVQFSIDRICRGCWPVLRDGEKRARAAVRSFYFLDFLQPPNSRLVGRPAVCSNEKVSNEGRRTPSVGAAGWAGRRGRYRFRPAWRGERPPPALPALVRFLATHALRVTGSKLTAAGSLLLLPQNRSLAAGARRCVPIFFFFLVHAHTHARALVLLYRCLDVTGLIRRVFAARYVVT